MLLCPFISKPRALQGDESRGSSARKHFQETLKACLVRVMDLLPPELEWKTGTLAQHQAHTARLG